MLTSRLVTGNLQLTFPTEPGFIYRLESTSDLAAASWIPLVADINGDGAWVRASMPILPGRLFLGVQIIPGR